MRNLFTLTAAVLFAAVSFAQDIHPRVHGDILAKIHFTDRMPELQADFESAFGTPLRHEAVLFPSLRIQHFSFDHQNLNEVEVLRWFKNHDLVETAQFNYLIQERLMPNDPLIGNQWHHVNNNDKDIDSDLAWDITTGGTTAAGDEIVVCVVEGGGAQYQHVDLIGNHWTNTNETDGNGTDDDDNGYIDDINGWNPVGNNDNISGGSHGTQVSGMIGAKGNNSLGISGVNWDVKIMQVMVGGLTQANVIAAYNYPYVMRELYNTTNGERGAFVVAVNSSWGIDNANPNNFPLWCGMYDTMGEVGILNCGATANNNVNIDNVGDMPTACPSEYMISITATNNNDMRTFSGFGLTTVDLGAPGESVYVTNNNNGYGNATGTSFASPCVAGAVALMYSVPCTSFALLAQSDPQTAAAMVRDAIFEGVDQTTQLLTQTTTGGRLNVHNSLLILLDGCSAGSCFTPSQINVTTTGTTANVSWNAIGSPESFELEYRPVGDIDWIPVTGILENSFVIENLMACTEYECHVRALCADKEVSEWSADIPFITDGCCEAPEGVMVAADGNALVITWSSVLAATSYTVHISTDLLDLTFPGLTAPGYTFEPTEECTTYTVIIETICDGGKDLVSAPVSITTFGCGACNDLNYCASASENSSEEWLQSVVIGSFSNISGNNDGYGDFTGTTIPMQTLMPYAVTLTPGFDGFSFNELYQLWIDLNHDGVFSANEKLLGSTAGSTQPFNGTLNIPMSGTLPGIARMRIIQSYTDTQNPAAPVCGDYGYGETEDYCVDITIAPGVGEQAALVQFDVFPNPAADQLTVVHGILGGRALAVITDVTGREISRHALSGPMRNIEVANLPAGSYFIQLMNVDGQTAATSKFIKE